jgi:hypothetical protein
MKFKDRNTDTNKFSSWLGPKNTLWLIPTNHRISYKINRKLNYQYPEDVRFTEFDEPVFKITTEKQLDDVLKLLSSDLIKPSLIE